MDNGKLRYMAGILIGLIAISYSLADLFISARNALYARSVVMSLIAWFSYIGLHYLETGRFLDPGFDEKTLPSSERSWVMVSVAAVLFSSGMGVGAVGVSRQSTLLAASGAASLTVGYFIAHYEFTDLIV